MEERRTNITDDELKAENQVKKVEHITILEQTII